MGVALSYLYSPETSRSANILIISIQEKLCGKLSHKMNGWSYRIFWIVSRTATKFTSILLLRFVRQHGRAVEPCWSAMLAIAHHCSPAKAPFLRWPARLFLRENCKSQMAIGKKRFTSTSSASAGLSSESNALLKSSPALLRQKLVLAFLFAILFYRPQRYHF